MSNVIVNPIVHKLLYFSYLCFNQNRYIFQEVWLISLFVWNMVAVIDKIICFKLLKKLHLIFQQTKQKNEYLVLVYRSLKNVWTNSITFWRQRILYVQVYREVKPFNFIIKSYK